MYYIYNNQNISTFSTYEQNNGGPVNDLLINLKNTLLHNDNTLLNTDGSTINTENDLKCIIFHLIKSMHAGLIDLDFEVHSEESDIIAINDNYCNNLTETGDISNQDTRTRQTDITITIDAVEGDEIGIAKGYSRFGDHIDIELKYIRKGYSRRYLGDIRRDLCKLKYLVDPTQEHHADHNNNQAPSRFGLFILGFRHLNILNRFLYENENPLFERIQNFNQNENVATILFYREN